MSTLESYLTTIADAIREKKGTTEPINASNFASEILSIQGGGSLNVAYSLTPPTDTSKIWLQCAEPSGIEVQNYLGECAVSNVANWGVIENPTTSSYFRNDYFSTCYIGNNQIAIIGYNHIRIYDLTSKSYIADYTISGNLSSNYYRNAIYKDGFIYYAYRYSIYKFELSTQINTSLYTYNELIYYIFFSSDDDIDCLCNSSSSNLHYRYNLSRGTNTKIAAPDRTTNYFYFSDFDGANTIYLNKKVYCFYLSSGKTFIYSTISNEISKFTSYINFLTDLGITNNYNNPSVVYDEKRYIYIIGGGNSTIGFRNIIKYDTVNDTFEKLGISLLGGKASHFSLLIDNRVYIFGGDNDSTNNNYGRPNQIDYFDISYPLPQNNAIITIANYKDDNALPLINTEKLKLNSNISSAYLGNADNLAEKVNAYYWNGTKWVGINCDDYREPESGGTGGGISGGGDATTDPEIPVDKPVEI